MSLSQGELPSMWKKTNITPVFTSGDTSVISNYRPIALTSIVCKIMETVIASTIRFHLSGYLLLSPEQHGFKRSLVCNTTPKILDKPCPPKIDAVFLDFAKAFDMMPHDVLLYKLAKQYNSISGNIWKWIKSFVSGRDQRVLYKGSISPWLPVSSGIPQGSVSGPLLFNLFINDLPLSTCLLFADDTLLYKPITCPEDELVLQRDLDQIHCWCLKNRMLLNVNKTKVMWITWSRYPGVPKYTLNNAHLDVVTEYKYLDVVLNNRLTWDLCTVCCY